MYYLLHLKQYSGISFEKACIFKPSRKQSETEKIRANITQTQPETKILELTQLASQVTYE